MLNNYDLMVGKVRGGFMIKGRNLLVTQSVCKENIGFLGGVFYVINPNNYAFFVNFTNNEFFENGASLGGVIYLLGSPSQKMVILFENNWFIANGASSYNPLHMNFHNL